MSHCPLFEMVDSHSNKQVVWGEGNSNYLVTPTKGSSNQLACLRVEYGYAVVVVLGQEH